MAIKLKNQNKISLFLYLLFLTCIYFWIYFDTKYRIYTAIDMAKNTNSNCFIYKDISSFCFFGWILTLSILLVFIINNVATNGIKALKKPALIVLATAILFVIAELVFIALFKR